MGNLATVTDSDFQKEVLESDRPVLVDFFADWCGPCKMLAPVVERIARRFGDRLKVLKLNTDDSQHTALKYQVRSIPTLILFRNGEAVGKRVGFVSEDDLARFVEEHTSEVPS